MRNESEKSNFTREIRCHLVSVWECGTRTLSFFARSFLVHFHFFYNSASGSSPKDNMMTMLAQLQVLQPHSTPSAFRSSSRLTIFPALFSYLFISMPSISFYNRLLLLLLCWCVFFALSLCPLFGGKHRTHTPLDMHEKLFPIITLCIFGAASSVLYAVLRCACGCVRVHTFAE